MRVKGGLAGTQGDLEVVGFGHDFDRFLHPVFQFLWTDHLGVLTEAENPGNHLGQGTHRHA